MCSKYGYVLFIFFFLWWLCCILSTVSTDGADVKLACSWYLNSDNCSIVCTANQMCLPSYFYTHTLRCVWTKFLNVLFCHSHLLGPVECHNSLIFWCYVWSIICTCLVGRVASYARPNDMCMYDICDDVMTPEFFYFVVLVSWHTVMAILLIFFSAHLRICCWVCPAFLVQWTDKE